MTLAHYAFNDMHAVMAYVGRGRYELAEALVRDRKRYLAAADPSATASRPRTPAGGRLTPWPTRHC